MNQGDGQVKQYVKTGVMEYRHLLHIKTLINTIENDLKKGTAINVNGQIKKELEKIKREFLRLRKETCKKFDLIDSDDITLEEYGPENILISSKEKVTFGDWFFRVMPRVSLAFYYNQYSPHVTLFCESSEINFPLDEGKKFLFWEGPLYLIYEGNDIENIAIKLVSLRFYSEEDELLASKGAIPAAEPLEIEILRVNSSTWQKIEVPKKGEELRPGDKFRWRSSTYQLRAEK